MTHTMTNILRIWEAQEGNGMVLELMPFDLNNLLKRAKSKIAWFTNSS